VRWARFRVGLVDRWKRYPVGPLDDHMEAAAQWLLAAQAATPDDGIAHSLDALTATWKASYPETTGYAIETLYAYARRSGRARYAEAARKAADWEVSVQLPEGGVMAGTIDATPVVPTIFNTGQVLFGWAAAAQHEVQSARYLQALRRAGDWLIGAMDDDGAWRRYSSPFGARGESAFNTRTAFGLARAGAVLGDERYLRAAIRHVRYVAAQARPNGFLPHNCLEDESRPLVHTLAYSIRGLLEVGATAAESGFVDLAVRMARGVASAQRADGAIPGRLDREWRGRAAWVCVTGNCQMALNWLRLAKLGITAEFIPNAVAANRYVMALQHRSHPDPDIRGAIRGSHPISAPYMRYRYPNWAAKFFLDALMLEAELREEGWLTGHHGGGQFQDAADPERLNG